MNWFMEMEASILLFLQNEVRSPMLTSLMNGITAIGNGGIVPILVCLLLICIPKTRKTGVMAAASLLLEFVILNLTIKPLAGRIRPYEVIQGLTCVTAIPHDFSFPSGHTGCCFAVASVIYLRMPKWYGIPAVAIAALVGFSRLYLGVHYPSDVLVGMLIGLAAGYFIHWTFSRRAFPWENK